MLDEQQIVPSEGALGIIKMIIMYSALTEYTKYTCTLKEEKSLRDTFIYQVSKANFQDPDLGNVVPS